MAHIIVFALIMLGSRSTPLQFYMYKNRAHSVPVVFNPLLKKGSLQHGLVAQPTKGAQKNVAKRSAQLVKKQTPTQAPQKKPVQPAAAKKTVATKQPNVLLNTNAAAKKVVPKKTVEPKKQPVEEKKVEQKPEPTVQEQKIVEPVEEKIITDPSIEPIVQQLLALQFQQEQLVLGRDDVEMYKAYVEIQEQINEQWTPPAGFGELAADVRVKVDQAGNVIQMTIEKSSGVLAFDVSTKMVCKHITWPALCYNKETIITFRQ